MKRKNYSILCSQTYNESILVDNFATIYLVRHGQTEWNVAHITQGQMDSALTKEGEQQVKDLARQLKHVHFDAIFTSDLGRAKRSADIINQEHQVAIIATQLLRERAFGPLEGRKSSEYRAELRYRIAKIEKMTEAERFSAKLVPEMESDAELVSRFITYVREIAIAYAGKTVLMVTHGGIVRTFLAHLGFAKQSELPGGSFSNAGYIKFQTDGVEFMLDEVVGVKKKTAVSMK